MSYWHEERKCKMCGQMFRATRNGRAETCGDACRKRWSRRKTHAIDARDSIMHHLAAYRRMLKEYPDLKADMLEQLRFLKSEIHFLLLIGGDDDEQARIAMLGEQAIKRKAP